MMSVSANETEVQVIIKQQIMRRLLLAFIVLTSMFGTASAEPAEIKNGQQSGQKSTLLDANVRDSLDVQIVSVYDYAPLPSEPTCPFLAWVMTSDTYDWYCWESSFDSIPGMGVSNEQLMAYDANKPGWIRVTVGNADGNVGTAYVWLDILNVHQMEDFIMTIGSDGYPTFSGIANTEHTRVMFQRANGAGNFEPPQIFPLSPGDWNWKDVEAYFDSNNTWVYAEALYDTCEMTPLVKIIPGLHLEVKEEQSNYYLDMKSVIQGNEYYQNTFGIEFVYLVYSIDENGVRHHFVEGSEPVVLPDNATRWEISENPDPYLAVGVAEVTEDGNKLLSLSRWVENPYYDPYNFNENNGGVLSVYPNPAKGRFTVEGTGHLMVSNMLGQSVMTMEIDGKAAIELPQGLYFVKMGAKTRKIVVE